MDRELQGVNVESVKIIQIQVMRNRSKERRKRQVIQQPAYKRVIGLKEDGKEERRGMSEFNESARRREESNCNIARNAKQGGGI